MQGGGDEQSGWLVLCSMDVNTGAVQMCKNYTYPTYKSLLPFTRTMRAHQDGVIVIANLVNFEVDAIDARTGDKVWSDTLETPYGDGTPNRYDTFGIYGRGGNGVLVLFGLGGDVWAYNPRTGKQLWYTNTTTLNGDPGIETPYDIWPLWVFSCQGFTNDVAYLAIGHEYNPPLFHGAQLLAINMTDGSLIWKELGTYIRSIAIAYGVLLSLNAYDNQIYAFGKGPTATTVSAPSVGVTTATPITITGTVMDVSAGVAQSEVAKNFPNGLPCVSDESQSKWMEYVYQNQPCPGDTVGVQVTLSVIDDNGNFREIGTTTTNAMGTYGFTWTPDIPGNFDLIATFAGSNSYYQSSAETYFYASEAPAPTAEPTPAPQSAADMYFIPMSIGIIVAIIIVGLLLAILLLRKR
jgi:outer membrane protein assembly factor BamB